MRPLETDGFRVHPHIAERAIPVDAWTTEVPVISDVAPDDMLVRQIRERDPSKDIYPLPSLTRMQVMSFVAGCERARRAAS